MKLVGLMTVRNEEWVLGLSLRAALRFVDEMVVLDHASTDGTAALVERIAAEHPGRVRSLREVDPVWREVAWRQRLLEAGRAAGAT
ncbi:MAG: glycosyltransferase family 2 protein, partial [Acidobacteriota bacterium]|nr:glycosyltransferase family 2 protein [Acidobacteriota bacterium]